MGRTGTADLPLHGGRVPEWLASRMARLGSVMVVNLTDRRAGASREATLELSREPERVLRELPRLRMPAHHDVRKSDVFLRRLHGTLAAARDVRAARLSRASAAAGCGRAHGRGARGG